MRLRRIEDAKLQLATPRTLVLTSATQGPHRSCTSSIRTAGFVLIVLQNVPPYRFDLCDQIPKGRTCHRWMWGRFTRVSARCLRLLWRHFALLFHVDCHPTVAK